MPLRITPSVAEQEGQQTETEATGAPQKHHYTLNQQVGSITVILEELRVEQNKSLQKQVSLKQQAVSCEDELKKIAVESQEDLVRCEQFVHFLDEEYLKTLSTRLDSAFQERDDCDALLQFLSCVALKNQREDLLNLTEKYSG